MPTTNARPVRNRKVPPRFINSESPPKTETKKKKPVASKLKSSKQREEKSSQKQVEKKSQLKSPTGRYQNNNFDCSTMKYQIKAMARDLKDCNSTVFTLIMRLAKYEQRGRPNQNVNFVNGYRTN